MLKKIKLSNSNIELTNLSLGTASMGNLYKEASDEQCFNTLNESWNIGIRYFDTAPFYGYGLSEKRVGEFLKTKNKSDYTISTKVGRLLIPDENYSKNNLNMFINPLPFRPCYDYSYDGIMRSIESSYNRLGFKKIDIAYIHDIGEMTHGDENKKHIKNALNGGIKALHELKSNNFIGAIGIGVNETNVCLRFIDESDCDIFLLAGRYTLLEQDPLIDLFPKCKKQNIDIVAGGVFNSGILVNYDTHTPMYNYAPAPRHIMQKVNALLDVCNIYNVALPAAAIQFAHMNDVIKSVLVGASRESHITKANQWMNDKIPLDFWYELKEKGLLNEQSPIKQLYKQ